jgi:hypothetical protein
MEVWQKFSRYAAHPGSFVFVQSVRENLANRKGERHENVIHVFCKS